MLNPSLRIVGFVSPPINSCETPYAELNIVANGDADSSDTFFILANNVEIYRWTGETMAWAIPPGANTYSVSGVPADLLPNTTITVRVVTYSGVNPGGSPVYAGDAVTVSQISWNCTSGIQVGEIATFDLRPKPVFAVPLLGLLILGMTLAWSAVYRLSHALRY
jgi:hypothetical protein